MARKANRTIYYTITGVEFGHFTFQDIKRLSVAKVTNPDTFDYLRRPNVGGLHDPRLGPFQNSRCGSCGRNSFNCEGHAGHIELPIAVYNPLFFEQILRLLRAQCIYCQRLRLPQVQVNRFTCKLRLLQYGLVQEVSDLDNMHIRKLKKTTPGEISGLPSPPRDEPTHDSVSDSSEHRAELDDEDGDEEDVQAFMERRSKYVDRCINRQKKKQKREKGATWDLKNSLMTEERRRVIKEFMSEITKARKCPYCLGESPAIRKDKSTMLFRKPLEVQKKERMELGNYSIPNPISLRFEKLKQEALARSGVKPHGAEEEIARSRATTKSMEEMLNMKYLMQPEVYSSLDLLIRSEQELFDLVYSSRPVPEGTTVASVDMFFLRMLLVPPNRFRPEAVIDDGRMAEDSQNMVYISIVRQSNIFRKLRDAARMKRFRTPGDRRRNHSSMVNSMVRLQGLVNQLIDKTKNPNAGQYGPSSTEGIRQLLEKKEGLFRHNMMGKRVNFAARTVLSPDPNVEPFEIGVPEIFAKKLVYPVPVTEMNYDEMKQFVLNGFFTYPGATIIENEEGRVLSLKSKSADERVAIANNLLVPEVPHSKHAKPKIVHRHLISGDWVLMNRQPTLHKPSIMAHKARVLKGETTFRMHYTNCNTYNADFDGDEMNMHFPQTSVGQREAEMIAATDHQYLSATSGKPLRGLIQDHISGGTWFTARDTMFDAEEYMHLLYAALRPEDGHSTNRRILMIKPAIIRPSRRWTGKQVITTLLMNIKPEDREHLTMTGKSSTPATSWAENSEEGSVLITNGYMITGILDKSHLGPTEGGLISCVHEIYGAKAANIFIGVLGRLFTKFQHLRPFTCGMDDLFLTPEGEFERSSRLKEADRIGHETALKYVLMDKESRTKQKSELMGRLADVFKEDDKQRGLDTVMNAQTAKLSSEITSACMPRCLAKKFPRNGMQTMTLSGAKGSQVNANLISCNLGQQVLEGRRVPVMSSGKTLPCFTAFETRPIAGGYVASRFLTGIRPQEYFFHAMAGREGLIDTAVKTSRSGYLQRCLVKGMEGLKAEYDGTVRESDKSIVQFLYGEDGLEVTKARSFTRLSLLAKNYLSVIEETNCDVNWRVLGDDWTNTMETNKKIIKQFVRSGKVLDINDPMISRFNPRSRIGVVSEKFFHLINDYIKEDPDSLVSNKANSTGVFRRNAFRALMDMKYMESIVQPGEAVGVVAAQSVGEPSTQMTLNTFHLAGHSAKNVTLGIPRLREIVMTASANLKTPVMTLNLKPGVAPRDGDRLAKSKSKWVLADCIDSVTVRESAGQDLSGADCKVYDIHIRFFPAHQYEYEYEVYPETIATRMEEKFIPEFVGLVKRDMKKKKLEAAGEIITEAVPDVGRPVESILDGNNDSRPAHTVSKGGVRDGDSSDEEEDDDADTDAKAAAKRANRKAGLGYDNPDEDEEEILREIEQQEQGSDGEIEGGDEKAPTEQDGLDYESPDEQPATARVGRHAPPPDGSIYLEKGDRSKKALKREANVLEKIKEIARFRFDKRGGWASIRLTVQEGSPKFLVLPYIEAAAQRTILQEISKIGLCQLVKERKYDIDTRTESEYHTIITEGVNLMEIRNWQDVIDPETISSNDIVSMLNFYGVEAARATIVSELTNVFKSHGITVDARHLNLIADTMTRGGGFTPFNRTGLKSSLSPLMKMSFETTFQFLKDATDDRDYDDLSNPSARIIIGRSGNIGTGTFGLITENLNANVRTEDAFPLDEEEGATGDNEDDVELIYDPNPKLLGPIADESDHDGESSETEENDEEQAAQEPLTPLPESPEFDWSQYEWREYDQEFIDEEAEPLPPVPKAESEMDIRLQAGDDLPEDEETAMMEDAQLDQGADITPPPPLEMDFIADNQLPQPVEVHEISLSDEPVQSPSSDVVMSDAKSEESVRRMESEGASSFDSGSPSSRNAPQTPDEHQDSESDSDSDSDSQPLPPLYRGDWRHDRDLLPGEDDHQGLGNRESDNDQGSGAVRPIRIGQPDQDNSPRVNGVHYQSDSSGDDEEDLSLLDRVNGHTEREEVDEGPLVNGFSHPDGHQDDELPDSRSSTTMAEDPGRTGSSRSVSPLTTTRNRPAPQLPPPRTPPSLRDTLFERTFGRWR